MVLAMPERNTMALTHMGGEGATWIGQSPFTHTEHIFQNVGDGTFFHSAMMAVRAAVVANGGIHVQSARKWSSRHDRWPADRGRAIRGRCPRA